MRTLRALVDRVWAGAAAGDRPLIAVPEAGFATNLNITLQLQYFDTFLQHCADAVDRVAYHMCVARLALLASLLLASPPSALSSQEDFPRPG